jgi:SAM-dependent methyltransferase
MSEPGYVLGHSDFELERLRSQAAAIDPITREIFRDAGIGPGMRVLDVGSGVGDVAFLAAEAVGERGEVLGADRSATALGIAKARAKERGLRHVTFVEGELLDLEFDGPFDAVTGRYVLMFQPDPVALLRKLAGYVRPGGVIVFHEIDWDAARSFPVSPVHDRLCRWLIETVKRSGAEVRMGARLPAAFEAAGLPWPSMRLGAVIGGGANAAGEVRLLTDLARTLLPEMERLGVATAAEVGLETLADRMLEEAIDCGSVLIGRSEIGAWTRV